jgi:hypothetical protein
MRSGSQTSVGMAIHHLMLVSQSHVTKCFDVYAPLSRSARRAPVEAVAEEGVIKSSVQLERRRDGGGEKALKYESNIYKNFRHYHK